MEYRGIQYDVATIGNYTKDTVATPTRERHVDGGGVAYSAYAAAGLGCRVAAITRLAQEDCPRRSQPRARRHRRVFPVATGSSTLMRLEYPTANVDERILTVAATAGSFTSDAGAGGRRRAAIVISASIRGEVPIEVIRELRTTGATDQPRRPGFRPRPRARRLGSSTRPGPRRARCSSLVDILKADAVEAESLTGETDIAQRPRALWRSIGPREVVVTHRDGVLVLADGEIHEARFHPASLVGRSGRGDTCLGSYVAARLTLAARRGHSSGPPP